METEELGVEEAPALGKFRVEEVRRARMLS